MNWLSDFVRPKIKKNAQKEIADDLWLKCPNCGKLLFTKELKKTWYVCPECDYHLRLYLDKRLKMLFDNGLYAEVALKQTPEDPLKFKDSKKYTERLRSYRKATGRDDAIVVAKGNIGGVKCVMAVLNFAFMGGSMGMAVGEGIVRAAEIAIKNKIPLITVASSGGARMQEGILSLMQMATRRPPTTTTRPMNMLSAELLRSSPAVSIPPLAGMVSSYT